MSLLSDLTLLRLVPSPGEAVRLRFLCPGVQGSAKKEVSCWNALLDGSGAHIQAALWTRGNPGTDVCCYSSSRPLLLLTDCPLLAASRWTSGLWVSWS